MIELLGNEASNSSSKVYKLDADNSKRSNKNNNRVIVATGTFDGAIITVDISANGVDFATLTNNTFTSAVAKSEHLPSELFIKATVTNAGTSTNINLHVA